MSQNEEKKKALKVLCNTMMQVEKAKEAMESFADEYRVPRPGSTISIPELTLTVAKITGYSAFYLDEAFRCAFKMMRDLDLTVTEENEDEA